MYIKGKIQCVHYKPDESFSNSLQVRKTTLLLCGSGFMREMPSAVLPVVPIISWSTMSCPIETKSDTSSVQTGQQTYVFASFVAILLQCVHVICYILFVIKI